MTQNAIPYPIALLLCLTVSGCSAETERIDCAGGSQELEREVRERWEDPNGCASDCECTTAAVEIRCPGGAQVWGCLAPVHVDSREAYEAVLQGVEDDLCPRISDGCFGGPGCAARVGACVDGRCVLVEAPGDSDAGPADAGAADAGAVDACVPDA